ncbi:hypothetical protein GGI43DRAFT_400027 [Trichoderma evansii]
MWRLLPTATLSTMMLCLLLTQIFLVQSTRYTKLAEFRRTAADMRRRRAWSRGTLVAFVVDCVIGALGHFAVRSRQVARLRVLG